MYTHHKTFNTHKFLFIPHSFTFKDKPLIKLTQNDNILFHTISHTYTCSYMYMYINMYIYIPALLSRTHNYYTTRSTLNIYIYMYMHTVHVHV